MFGYIRPLKSELKIREFEMFRACYCGLCHTLGAEYGLAGRMILSYDFVFFAMLTWEPGDAPTFCRRRCMVSPFRRLPVCAGGECLARSAAAAVLFARHRALDGVRDARGIRRLPSAAAALLLKGSARKAEQRLPALAAETQKRLEELQRLEQAGEPRLDQAADVFAGLMARCADTAGGGRALEQLLYHTGRWIYILDAWEDLKEDAAAGRYNPVAARFGLTDGCAPAAVKEAVSVTLENSLSMIRTAYELLPENLWSGVLRNIIYLGMEDTTKQVLDGTYRKQTGRPR